MLYLEHRVARPLADFVDMLWYCEDYRAPHRREVVFPNGATAIVIALRHERMPNWSRDLAATEPESEMGAALIAGAHTGYMVIDTMALDSLLGVHFRPGAALPFFGVPLEIFRNTHEALDAVWPRAEVDELRNRAREAPSPQAKLACLEAALWRRLSGGGPSVSEPVSFAIQRFNRVPHIETVAEVSAQTGLSTRRLSDLFQRHVGVAPKVYCRIRRFRSAVARMNDGREIDWAQLALDCGYYDQPHFLHEFREFSGMNPTAYSASRGGAWQTHVAV